ncbi:glycosyltransferase family 4 protein [Salinibacter ruber]|uniref:glycosyltransferase family 4 protein n=1 Tax=Salinibacter ruber TaxID=146919 RepID=UPI0021694DA7|nr:glycosyltransferase family 4 protein [Salinibacter ruber]MCS3783593.1 glycosyltransferase involved in cell wall biosynthesis [Salinibacter ruber]
MANVCMFSSVHDALDNRVFYREARSLQGAGHDVTLIAIHPESCVKEGIRIVGLPAVPRWQRPKLWIEIVRKALALNADVYHFHDPELLVVAPVIRAITGSPTIYDCHEVYADFIRVKDYMSPILRYPIAEVFRVLEPLLARLQSALIFSDNAIARSFKSIDCPKKTLFNFPARFLIEEGKQATIDLDDRPPTIVHLGGHERSRGTRLMIDAFAEIRQRMSDAHLRLVGHYVPEELETEVRNHIRRRGLENDVTIEGRVPFEEIGAYLTEASVGWVPFQPCVKYDLNIPTKLFEYMAYGLPIVSSHLQSTEPFVVDGENGFLVEATSPEAHADAHTWLLKNSDKAQSMGKHGQRLVDEQFNWDRMEERLLSLYDELLSEHPDSTE